jgi:hypothetical protein
MSETIYSSRKEAKAAGAKTYNGKPCKNCGTTLKNTRDYGCISCRKEYNNSDSKREYSKEYSKTPQHKAYKQKYEKTPKYKRTKRNQYLRNMFGISIEEYDNMFSKQNGVCAICLKPQNHKKLAVDHNHISGTIRGLLCDACNRGLGQFKDNSETLKRASEYLTSFSLEE